MARERSKPVEFPPIPVGLENLLSLAAAHPPFEEELLSRRLDAALAAKEPLSRSERAILVSADEAFLRRMIEEVRRAQPDRGRRRFLGQAMTAVLTLAAGSSSLVSCKTQRGGKGNEPGAPKDARKVMTPEPSGTRTEARPEARTEARPEARPEARADPSRPTSSTSPDSKASPGESRNPGRPNNADPRTRIMAGNTAEPEPQRPTHQPSDGQRNRRKRRPVSKGISTYVPPIKRSRKNPLTDVFDSD